MSELDELAQCLKCFTKDCFGDERAAGDFGSDAKEMIESGEARVVRVSGKIAAIARKSRFNAITSVYTVPEHRGKGFAQALVYNISSEITEQGLVPRLYADGANPYSTAAYRKVGFSDCGEIRELTLAW